MVKKYTRLAICYDFDGTLAPGNMQEFEFVPDIGMTTTAFWAEVTRLQKKHEGDNILIYMWLMLKKARAAGVSVRKDNIEAYGATIPLFDGVEDWFDRIDAYGRDKGIKVGHFIISSGLREMIAGTPIARKFKAIFASSFLYDENGVACWPALALNYTTKTQYLFRINKGNLQVSDHSRINKYIPQNERDVPFKNIVFIGDGVTDIPCFRLVKDQGGHSIAVYQKGKRGAKKDAEELIKTGGRVNFALPADYTDGSKLDRAVKAVVDKVAADDGLSRQGKRE
jgi:phosphoserine phosphatase